MAIESTEQILAFNPKIPTSLEGIVKFIFEDSADLDEEIKELIVIEALRRYLDNHQFNPQKLANILSPYLFELTASHYDECFAKLANPYITKVMVNNDDLDQVTRFISEGKTVENEHSYYSFRNSFEIALPDAVVEDLLLSLEADAANTQDGIELSSDVAVQLYDRHRDSILSLNSAEAVENMVNYIAKMVQQIQQGLSNREILELQEAEEAAEELQYEQKYEQDMREAIYASYAPRPY